MPIGLFMQRVRQVVTEFPLIRALVVTILCNISIFKNIISFRDGLAVELTLTVAKMGVS